MKPTATALTLLDAYLAMWIAPVIALVTALYLILVRPEAVLVAAPILLFWWLSPAIIWWVSEPLARRTSKLTPDQTVFLRKTARKTWAYFENLVGVQDNWLPPDNYQVYREVGVAHRTSPTNMGMALLANLSAYDFGYLPLGGLIERTANTLRTMERLERYHGHFYNWYDTQSLQPLLPMYVSTVDSGNLGGHLLTLQPGLLALPDQPILAVRWLEGLVDTFGVLLENTPGMTPHQLIPLQMALDVAIKDRPVTLAAVKHCLEHLTALDCRSLPCKRFPS